MFSSRCAGFIALMSSGTYGVLEAFRARPQKWINQSNCAGPGSRNDQDGLIVGGGGGVKYLSSVTEA